MGKYRVTTERTQQVVWLIGADSEEEAKEYYGEGEITEEDYGAFDIDGVQEVSEEEEL